jgi:hypothetical protein
MIQFKDKKTYNFSLISKFLLNNNLFSLHPETNPLNTKKIDLKFKIA